MLLPPCLSAAALRVRAPSARAETRRLSAGAGAQAGARDGGLLARHGRDAAHGGADGGAPERASAAAVAQRRGGAAAAGQGPRTPAREAGARPPRRAAPRPAPRAPRPAPRAPRLAAPRAPRLAAPRAPRPRASPRPALRAPRPAPRAPRLAAPRAPRSAPRASPRPAPRAPRPAPPPRADAACGAADTGDLAGGVVFGAAPPPLSLPTYAFLYGTNSRGGGAQELREDLAQRLEDSGLELQVSCAESP